MLRPTASLAVAALLAAAPLSADIAAQQAAAILRATGFHGGLIVHVGCGDGALTTALGAGGNCIVQGLDADTGHVARARACIRAAGTYGRVSVTVWSRGELPYVDNTVNLLVVSDPLSVRREEMLRVLAPRGVAYIRQEDSWRKLVKPVPADTDEWTHYLYDASGNPVNHDQEVGPPRHLQWAAGPRYTRSHEHTPSVGAIVSSGGRVFALIDEAPIWSILLAPQWHLVARDAYNGVLLWRRPLREWWPHICGWTQGPRQLHRRVVAVGDRVYATLGLLEPVSALDAATGRTLHVFAGTEGAEEIVCTGSRLLVVARAVTPERVTELQKWARLSRQKKSPLYTRDTMAPLVKELREIEKKAPRTLICLDVDSGRALWQKKEDDIGWLRPLSVRAIGDRVVYQSNGQVVAADLGTGKQLWATAAPVLRTVNDQHAIAADNNSLVALSLRDGHVEWKEKPQLISLRDAFVIGDTVWLGGFKPYQGRKSGKRGPAWGPYYVTARDLNTGVVVKTIEPENPGHHHRCYSNKATDRYILGGRRGTEFIDLKTGEVLWNSWTRGVCTYGIMACNGLLYVPPDACGCYVTAKLTGFYALAPQRKGEDAAPGMAPPVTMRGPAWDAPLASASKNPRAWPTYRHDGARSGCAPVSVDPRLAPAWQREVGGRLTSLTVAGGRVLVASPDDHRVCALDAATGRPAWEFTPGGAVDSPPTVWRGRALFGAHDGWVYSLRLNDGALAWRTRIARRDRRTVVEDRLESVSPAIGSVLVRTTPEGDRVFASAGRSSYLDGGIDLCRLEPRTGALASRTPIYSPDPKTGRQPPQINQNAMTGSLADILSTDDRFVYLRDQVFDLTGTPQSAGNPHLLTVTGFLDDTWAHRSYQIFGTHTSLSTGCSGRERGLIYGRLLTFDENAIYGYGRSSVQWSNQLEDGPYRLFSLSRKDHASRWTKSLPIQVRAMALAENVLLVAGPATPLEKLRFEERGDETGLLLALSTKNGAELGRCPLSAPPVLDGIAVADGRLYLATTRGQVIALAAPGS